MPLIVVAGFVDERARCSWCLMTLSLLHFSCGLSLFAHTACIGNSLCIRMQRKHRTALGVVTLGLCWRYYYSVKLNMSTTFVYGRRMNNKVLKHLANFILILYHISLWCIAWVNCIELIEMFSVVFLEGFICFFQKLNFNLQVSFLVAQLRMPSFYDIQYFQNLCTVYATDGMFEQ